MSAQFDRTLSPKSMSPAIEDFPGPLLCQLCNISPKSKRRVTFSSTNEMTFYERQDNVADLHYSRDDYRTMRADKKRAIEEERKRLLLPSPSLSSSLTPTEDSKDFECTLNRIENHVSSELMMKMTISRVRSLGAVFEKQTKQACSGVYDPYKLAQASRCHSEWAAMRAFAVGMLQQLNREALLSRRKTM